MQWVYNFNICCYPGYHGNQQFGIVSIFAVLASKSFIYFLENSYGNIFIHHVNCQLYGVTKTYIFLTIWGYIGFLGNHLHFQAI